MRKKLLTNHKEESFLSSIQNVASNIQIDFNMKKNKFVEKYGHIRPNTYNIKSLNYKNGYNFYFKKTKSSQKKIKAKQNFTFDKITLKKIDFLLKNKIVSI